MTEVYRGVRGYNRKRKGQDPHLRGSTVHLSAADVILSKRSAPKDLRIGNCTVVSAVRRIKLEEIATSLRSSQ